MTYTAKTVEQLRNERGTQDLKLSKELALIETELNIKSFINSGSYDGNNEENKPITHGLYGEPKLVQMINVTSGQLWTIMDGTSIVRDEWITGTVTEWTDTHFYVGCLQGGTYYGNETGNAYKWAAIG